MKPPLRLGIPTIIFFFAFTTLSVFAALPQQTNRQGLTKLPFNAQLRLQLDELFYNLSDRSLSLQKLTVYRQRIEKRMEQIKTNLEKVYRLNEGRSEAKSFAKIEKDDFIVAFKILLSYLDNMEQLRRANDQFAFDRQAVTALELDEALKVFGLKLDSTFLFERIPQSFKKRKIPIHDAPEGEASNLVDPVTGLFYNQPQLNRMKAEGQDISLLNPPADSTFWQPTTISRLDVKTHYQTGGDALHKGLKIIFPEGNAYFKKVRKTQSKPKVDIFIEDERGARFEFKLKIGAEMHSEATASSLFAALGFSVDISKYVKNFKLILGETTPYEFKKSWSSYYTKYNPDKYIKEEGEDQEGHYLIFHEALMEAKPDGLLRIGPWAYGSVGHKGLREVRGTLLFNMWLSNIDIKESENNKLIMRKIAGKERYFHIQHDMGFAFGKTYIERPAEFSWDIVKKKDKDFVHMDYRCFQQNSGLEHITFADARWIVRLIAKLSRDQITDAVALGGWPESLGKLLTEKLIARRNQLVENFGLDGEELPQGGRISLLNVKRKLTTADGVVVNGKLKIYRYPGFIQFFGPRIQELLPKYLRSIRNMVVDKTRDGMGAVRYFEIQPEWIGAPDSLITRILIRTDREIEINPSPTGENDTYLVKDFMELGFRLGYGDAVSADISFKRKYSAVYPVRTMNDARFHNNFIVNLMLPGQIKKFGADQKFVALTEDYFETRVRGKLGGYSLKHSSPIGADAALSQIYLKSSLISRKSADEMIYFEDFGHMSQLNFRFFLEFFSLFNFQIPIYNSRTRRGKLNRYYYQLDLTEPKDKALEVNAVKKLLLEDNPLPLRQLGAARVVADKFYQRKTRLNLLGAFKVRTIFREDRMKTARPDGGLDYYYQVESQNKRYWRILDNGEKHYSYIRLHYKGDEEEKIEEPVLNIFIRIHDKNTRDGELNKWYLPFLNRVSLDPQFIDFDSSLHTVNRHWGYLQVYLNIFMYKAALQRLMNAEPKEIWQALAQVTDRSAANLKKSSRPVYERGQPVYKYTSARGSDYLAVKTAYLIRELARARQGKGMKQARSLVRAVRKAVYVSGQGFEPALLEVLNRIVGKENFYIEAAVTMPVDEEMVFPERKQLFNRRGERLDIEPYIFEYIFDDPEELYHLFR